MRNPVEYIQESFRRKLIGLILAAVMVTALVIFLFLMNNFRSITQFSLKQNSSSLEATVEDYLGKYVAEKADSTWLQVKAAQDNLGVLGRTAQKLVDNAASIHSVPQLLSLPLFANSLESRHGSLTSRPTDLVNTYIPPPLVSDPQARKALEASALLNLSIDAVFDANNNNAFVYYVGNPAITRAYPNIDLTEALGDGRSNLFWKDFFAPNVEAWTDYFHSPDKQKAIPNPITVEAPYADAAGQGMMVTMFYPLWDKKTDKFAGAVGADITLAKIIENILSIQLAKTGFAFLMNGKGDIIAMPETGFRLLKVDLKETKQGSLSYYTGSLTSSPLPAVQAMAKAVLSNDHGLEKLNLTGNSAEGNIVVYASLPALSDASYNPDSWKIVVSVPEIEIFDALNTTHAAITGESDRIFWLSLAIMAVFLVLISWGSFLFTNRSTRDLQELALAAEKIALKQYNVELQLHSKDEIGRLGQTFTAMSREIRDYTVNLEAKVEARTADLSRANEEISRLNDVLKSENLRLGAELDVARRLQMMVLPPESETQTVKNLDIACFMQPADEVGGDYFDVIRSENSVMIGIGDVTGHGLPAGVIMLMAQTALLTLSEAGETDMRKIMNVLNQVLFKNILRIGEDKNMTLAVLQSTPGGFSLVGQHETVIVCDKNGVIRNIETIDLGLPVGLESDISSFIGVAHIPMEPGDTLVLYTDGVTEAEDPQQRQFGVEGLCSSLQKHYQLSSHEVLDRVMKDVFGYISGGKIHDDISMVVIKQK